MNSIYRFVKIDFCFASKFHGFLECKTLNYKTGWVMFNIPLTINTNDLLHLDSPPQRNKACKLLKLDDNMCTSLTILGSTGGIITCGQEKFTWSKRWESLFM
jgi:hypothetical protein